MLALSSLTLSSPISLLLPPLPLGSHCTTTTTTTSSSSSSSSSKDPSCCFTSSNRHHVCSCCHHSSLRYYDDSDAPRWSNNMNPQYSSSSSKKKNRNVMHPMAAASTLPPKESNPKVLKIAREKFAQEISFRSRDTDVSLAKALLLVAVEDEAFMAFNREMDKHSILNERKGSSLPFRSHSEFDDVEEFSLAGKSMSGWLNELDTITKEVEAELVTRDIGCHLVELVEAVNVVLFELRGFKRFPVLLHPKFSYLHTVLDSGCGSAIMLSIIYIEICHRLGVSIMGSRVGEDFLIWPRTENLKEIFKASSGHSWFSVVNGGCVKDPRSKAFELNSSSLLGLDIATNRDIIGIALANLIRLHWKRASKMNHGLMLTTPLRPIDSGGSKVPLLRPLELRLALMASERLLLLQPHNWTLRRDHGMLLYYSRRYAEAVQELSICMAFAPVEEAEVMEPFVEKLHLLRLESSWKSLDQAGSLAVP